MKSNSNTQKTSKYGQFGLGLLAEIIETVSRKCEEVSRVLRLVSGLGGGSYQPGTFGQPPNYYGSGRLEDEFSGKRRGAVGCASAVASECSESNTGSRSSSGSACKGYVLIRKTSATDFIKYYQLPPIVFFYVIN